MSERRVVALERTEATSTASDEWPLAGYPVALTITSLVIFACIVLGVVIYTVLRLRSLLFSKVR